MSLMRLLAAGRSLMGQKNAGGRYRLPDEPALPRFEAKKNLFRAPAPVAAAASPPAAAGRAEAGKECATNRPSLPSLAERQSPGDASLLKKVRNFFRAKGRVTSRKVEARGGKGLVQAELSLDSVRVVRNDLSDTDLEVVTAAAPAEVGGTKQAQPRPAQPGGPQGKQSTRQAATRVVGRLFGAGKT